MNGKSNIAVGQYHELEVIKRVDFGIYLKAGEDEILLPNRYVPEGTQAGDLLRVFIYRDSEDRLIATTTEPRVVAGEFAALRVVDANKFGVFLDWGLEKDLLVPFSEQYERMIPGKTYLVRVMVDRATDRVIATARIRDYLDKGPFPLAEGDQAQLLVWEFTQIGIKVVINDRYEGMLYQNEVFTELSVGSRLPGFIKQMREDGKIDVTLRKPGYGEIEDAMRLVTEKLEQSGGFLPLTDKSTPEEITQLLPMSKKTFKKAIGGLYKERKITLHPEGIRLIASE